MNLSDLASAVYTRLTGDATLSGYATGGIRHYFAQADADQSENAQKPYVVYVIDLGSHENTTRGQTQEMITTVMIYCPRTITFVTCSAMLERINGDATDQSNYTPTFGLHNWTPTLASGNWTSGPMYCSDGSSVTSDKDWFQYTLEFRNHLSRTCP